MNLHFARSHNQFDHRTLPIDTLGAQPPSQEDKWFPLNTCCGRGCSSSGPECVVCLIYEPVFVVAKIFITKDTGTEKLRQQNVSLFE